MQKKKNKARRFPNISGIFWYRKGVCSTRYQNRRGIKYMERHKGVFCQCLLLKTKMWRQWCTSGQCLLVFTLPFIFLLCSLLFLFWFFFQSSLSLSLLCCFSIFLPFSFSFPPFVFSCFFLPSLLFFFPFLPPRWLFS